MGNIFTSLFKRKQKPTKSRFTNKKIPTPVIQVNPDVAFKPSARRAIEIAKSKLLVDDVDYKELSFEDRIEDH